VLRIIVKATQVGYLATMWQVRNSHFGDERQLASDIPFTLPRRRLLELSTDLVQYGEELTDAFFADKALLTAWQYARDQAERLENQLQVRVEIDPSAAELHYVRWETLLDPERRGALAQNMRTSMVRYIHALSGVPIVATSRAQLRALVVIAGADAPQGFKLPRIDVEAEYARIVSALGSIPMVFLGKRIAGAPPASISQIRIALQQRSTIVYVVCHGGVWRDDKNQIKPYLWLENDQGNLKLVEAQRFVDVINDLDGPLRPALVVFSSCHSADDEREAQPRHQHQVAIPVAVAPRLAAAGVGAVIGMQGQVQQKFIARFIPTLFAQLLAGAPIDSAVAFARADLSESDWWVPVLYLRGNDAYLWRATEEHIVGDAGHAITGLKPDAAVLKVIGHFQYDLKRACEQLPMLKAYKDIHDQLHLLLVRGAYCIERDFGPRFAEPTATQEFHAYYLQAQLSIRLLYDASAQLPQGNREQRSIAQLARAYERLALAVARQDRTAFRAAILELFSGLGTLPVATNRSIVEKVQVLQIERLSRMMLELQGAVSGTQAAAVLQTLFATRAFDLHQLKLDLDALVNRHTEWQALDVIVRLLEQQGDTALIPHHWEELQLQVEAVRQLEPSETRAALLEHNRGLESALTAGDTQPVLRALERLALEVRHRFFALDKQLKERCDGLQSVGAEFKVLLDVFVL